MWPGAPFLYFNEKMTNAISISKIPSISIEPSFSWETIIAAFISGLVPAAISFYVIKKNNESIRYQQIQENNRHHSEYLRVIISEYVSHLNKTKFLHLSWISHYRLHEYSSKEIFNDDMTNKISDHINEMEKLRVGLLISIPTDFNGEGFKVLINEISDFLSEFILNNWGEYKDGNLNHDNSLWLEKYYTFIAKSGEYLNFLMSKNA